MSADADARRSRRNDRHPLTPAERADLRVTLAALADDPGAAAELVHGRTGAAGGPLSDLVRSIARDAVARLDRGPLAEPEPADELVVPEPRTAPDDAASTTRAYLEPTP